MCLQVTEYVCVIVGADADVMHFTCQTVQEGFANPSTMLVPCTFVLVKTAPRLQSGQIGGLTGLANS